MIVKKKVKQGTCVSDVGTSSASSRDQHLDSEKSTCLDEGQSNVLTSATAELKDARSSLAVAMQTMTATQLRPQDVMECSRASAENENNLNMEVENGRNSAGVARLNLPRGAGSVSANSSSSAADRSQSSLAGGAIAGLAQQSAKHVGSSYGGDEVILDVQLHDFSDEEFTNTSAPVAALSSMINIVEKNCTRLDAGELEGSKTAAHLQRLKCSDEFQRTEKKIDGSSDDSSRLQKDRNRNERRRSADDARSVIVAKIQRRSHPPDSITDARNRGHCTSSRSDDDEADAKLIALPSCVETNKPRGTSLDSDRISSVDAPKEMPDSKSKHEISSVRKIKITRPVQLTPCDPLTEDASRAKTSSANRGNASGSTGLSSVRGSPERKKSKQLTSSQSDKSNAQLSPEALSKTELEILELEMRARAIKAMLRAQEELERSDMTSASRHGQQQDRSKQHNERVRAEPPRRRVAEQSRVAATTRRVLTAPVRRSSLPSPPPSRHRVIHRNAINEIIVRRRQRQMALRDRLARFGHQLPPPSSSRTDARLKLNAVYVGRRVVHKPVHRSGSRVITLSSNYVSRSSVVTPLTSAPPSSSDLHRRRRSSGGNIKQVTAVDKSSGSNRGDVRRVCVTAPRRLVTMTSDRGSAPSKTQVQTARKNR